MYTKLLSHLQRLFERHGHLSGLLIDETEGMPSSSVYRGRFGSLVRAYGLVGYTPARDYRYIEINRYLRRMHPEMVSDVVANIERCGGVVDRDRYTDLLTINDEFSASLVLARCRKTEAGHHRWLIRFDAGLGPDITLAVRMAPGNREIPDYYLLSQVDLRPARPRIGEDNGLDLDCFRFDDLIFFFGMAERAQLPVAA